MNVHDFRGATLVCINHHIIPIFKKKNLDVIFFHVETNDSASITSREILNDLLQLQIVITKTLPNCQVIFLQPTFRVHNGKEALTLDNLNETISEINLDFVDNSSIKVKHISQKGLHLNPTGKHRLVELYTQNKVFLIVFGTTKCAYQALQVRA